MCIYRGPGWDWAIWLQTLVVNSRAFFSFPHVMEKKKLCFLLQTLVFSLLNIVIRLRKLGKDLREMMEHGAGVAGAVTSVAGAVGPVVGVFV